MLPMPFTRPSLTARFARFALPLAAVLAAAAVAPAAHAQGAPLPQGYTSDVVAGPQAPAPPVAPAPAQPAQAPIDPSAEQVDADGYADTDPSALTDFQEPLAPYRQWTEDPTYGTLWVPDQTQVGADFAPYQTAGSWGVGDSGDWMWQSDYAWGYIPFHYGRWVWAGSYWGWIPGRRYAPAWVSWRVGEGGYLGWAPTPPSWYWGRGQAMGLYTRPYAAYCFVPTNYAFFPNVSAYVVRDRGTVAAAAGSTRPYHPATPTVGQSGAGTHAPMRTSPTFSEAHIPASASPRSRAAADGRAAAFATHSGTASIQRAYGVQAGRPGAAYQGRSITLGNGGSRSAYGYERSAPATSAGRVQSSGLRTPAYSRGGYSGYRSAPSYYPSQHFGWTPGAFHPAAPSTHYSAPVPSTGVSHGGHVSTGHFSGGHHR